MRSLAYRQATFTFITSLHYRFSMLWTTDRHQHRERWLPLPRELIQSYITDMDLDPDSLSQVDEALISARLTWYLPLPLLLQYNLSLDQAILGHLLFTRLTDAEREAIASQIHHQDIAECNITPTEHIPDNWRPLGAHLGGIQFKRVTIIHSDKAPMRLKLL